MMIGGFSYPFYIIIFYGMMMINGVQSLDGNEFINSTQCDGLFDFQLSNNISTTSNISSSDISDSDFNVETYLKLMFLFIFLVWR